MMSLSYTILLPDKIRTEILSYCIRQYPYEACGFLLGAETDVGIFVDGFAPIANASHDPLRHFSMDPAAMLPYIYPAPAEGNKGTVVGILHSHPMAAAVPSDEDMQTSWKQISTHWIVSLVRLDAPDIRAYRFAQTDEQTIHALPVSWQTTL